MSHVPLSSKGHIGTMTDSTPSVNACGWFLQLQVWKLLQSGGWVVYPERLNGELKALKFTFMELPLWNDAAPGEPTYDPQMIGVASTVWSLRVWQSPFRLPLLHWCHSLPGYYHWASSWCHHGHQLATPGGLGAVAADFPHNLNACLPAQYAAERAAISGFGAAPSTGETEDPLRLEGMDSAIPVLMAIPTQVSLWVATPGDMPNITCVTHSPSLPMCQNTGGGQHLLHLTA